MSCFFFFLSLHKPSTFEPEGFDTGGPLSKCELLGRRLCPHTKHRPHLQFLPVLRDICLWDFHSGHSSPLAENQTGFRSHVRPHTEQTVWSKNHSHLFKQRRKGRFLWRLIPPGQVSMSGIAYWMVITTINNERCFRVQLFVTKEANAGIAKKLCRNAINVYR